MIALSLHDCEIKVTYYRQGVREAEQKLSYLRAPDKKREKQLKAVIRKYEHDVKEASDIRLKVLYGSLLEKAKYALNNLPQNLSEDALASKIADRKQGLQKCLRKLEEAIDELGALQATPELFEEIRASYTDLPPGIRGNPLVVLDNGTVLTDWGDVVSGKDIDLYRIRKVFDDTEVLDG